MSNIGKSGVDWDKAPEGATHYQCWRFCRLNNRWEYYDDDSTWVKSLNPDHWFMGITSKEEDLEMNTKETKVVRSVDDLELGMFLKAGKDKHLVVNFNTTFSVILVGGTHSFGDQVLSVYDSWSYTYYGEYTPIVKITEAEIKIKELEETIALAQKQLQEYKEMK